ncbi:hypothetical protein [Microbacterium karelineae]|uniref:SLAC1 family transporter n=1 Tax=Microbacterium karelineae TaxID=2654283 RepID=UPI0018D356B4|nr:hypothetical protein [Microbacterium karelineae]
MAISLGLAGTGSAWIAADRSFSLSPLIGELLFAASALLWALTLVMRFPFTPRRWSHLLADLDHPASGPFPAYVPVIALLLTAHYAPWLSPPMPVLLCLLWAAMLTVLCGYLLARWLGGELNLADIHPGYALPVIAGPYIASTALGTVGLRDASLAAFGAGTFCWIVIGTVIAGRLIVGGPLPAALTPTLAVTTTPPITAALAWFTYMGGGVDSVQVLLLGIIALLVVVQPFFIPAYRRAPFGMSWWAMLFPAGALAGYSLRWDAALHSATSTWIAIAALTTATSALALLASISLVRAARPARPSAALIPEETS